MNNLQLESKAHLVSAIKRLGLDKYSEQLLSIARECIRVVATSDLDEISVGMSRIGGPPDLFDESQWPKYGYGEGKDSLSVFYFQVNLSDLPLTLSPEMPNKGLLSIYSTSQNQLEDDGTVLFIEDGPDGCMLT